MYTGIVQGSYQVVELERRTGLLHIAIELDAPRLDGLQVGASVGVDGVCLTVTSVVGQLAHFDIMQQTLDHTTLGSLREGSRVNIERSARYGDEIGGHGISGHVDRAVAIVDIATPENNCELVFELPEGLRPYVFTRGFIGLNGCSLTVAEADAEGGRFKICLIPETLRITTFSDKEVGDRVNLEIDRQTQAIVDTVRNYLAQNPSQGT